jgi:hypothetical protein
VWLEVDRAFSHSFLAFASDADLDSSIVFTWPPRTTSAMHHRPSNPCLSQRDTYVGELRVRAGRWAHVEPPHGTPKLVR